MITKLNTYESVPIGTSNFEDLLEYIHSFMGANFGFSTNATTNSGGFFRDDDFVWVQVGTTVPNSAWVTTPTGVAEGSLFGRKASEYFRFPILNTETGIPQVAEWEILATNLRDSSGAYTLENNSPEDRMLPYRPVYFNTAAGNAAGEGYYDIRFNGVPQTPSEMVFLTDVSGFRTQNIAFSSLTMGAEYPRPVKDGRYDRSFVDPAAAPTSLDDFVDNYNSTLEFPKTNFSIDYGGHILLWDFEDRYAYIPQDISSAPEPAPGTYKVLDYARGVVKLNITNEQFNVILGAPDRFTVISAEQLQESVSAGITSFHSRYGNVYNGNTSNVKLIQYVFDGIDHRITPVPERNVSSGIGSILVSDTSDTYGDSVILAVRYDTVPNRAELAVTQETRYDPDTLTLYYSTGILTHHSGGTVDTLQALVENNDASWYNRDVLDSNYFPVSRARTSWFSILTEAEAALFDQDGVFDPNFGFAILEVLQLQQLTDVPVNLNDGDLLVYNGSTFDGVPNTLVNLRDVNISPSAATDRYILHYNHSLGRWVEGSLGSLLGYTPVNRAGDTGISGTLRYSSGSINLSHDNALITKKYVDDAVFGLEGLITNLTISPGPGILTSTNPTTSVVTVSANFGTSAGTVAAGNDPRFASIIPSTRTIGTSVGSGLTGGGNLTTDRYLSVDNSVVRTTRSVLGDDGITGGGDLSSNITLSVDGTVVRTSGNQTISGTKTFGTIPMLPSSNPTSANQAVRKAYVDQVVSSASGGVPTSRTISAGDGLTGGGNLTANRSFAVNSTVVRTSGNQSIGGTKTFSTIPVLPSSNPTGANHAVRKGYVDGLLGGVVRTSGNQSIGGTKTFTDISTRFAGSIEFTGSHGVVRGSGTSGTRSLFVYPSSSSQSGSVVRLYNNSAGALYYNAFTRVEWNATGVGISRTPATNMLEVNGNASKSSAGDWLANSDRRIKTDIKPAVGLDKLLQINPVTFRYKPEYLKTESGKGIEDRVYHNYIAQEVQEVFPDSVSETNDEFEGEKILQLDTHNINVSAVKAIQELHQMVVDLQSRIEILESV